MADMPEVTGKGSLQHRRRDWLARKILWPCPLLLLCGIEFMAMVHYDLADLDEELVFSRHATC
jgi:hypothetical protein